MEADVKVFQLRELWRRYKERGRPERQGTARRHSKAVLRLRSRLKSSG